MAGAEVGVRARRVNQLEIDAYKIRTELAQLEAANASGIASDEIAPEVAQPISNDAVQPALDWQPVADLIPDGMEILAGAPPQIAAPLPDEPSDHPTLEPVSIGESSISQLVNRSRGLYRRTTSPVMASFAVHAAILIAAISITVVATERIDSGPPTTLVLGAQAAKEKEVESLDPHQLADLGETGVQNALADLAQLDAVRPVDHEPIPIEFESFVSA